MSIFKYKIHRIWIFNLENKISLYCLARGKEFFKDSRVTTIYHNIFSICKDVSEVRQKQKYYSLPNHKLERSPVIYFLGYFIRLQFCLFTKELLLPCWCPSQLILSFPSDQRTHCCSVEVALLAAHLQEIGAPASSFNPIVQNLYLWWNSMLGLG